MEEKDPIENKFKSAFSDFEKEPPASVWENLDKVLHTELQPVGFWARIANWSLFGGLHPAFYLAFAGVSVTLVLAVFYLGSGRHFMVRGHAFAGVTRLCNGTAVLFQVSDKTMPWDSVTHYRSAVVDNYGHFQFPQVKKGKYILRIAPEEFSESASNFLPSWFDQHEKSDSCNLIIIINEDIYADVHLIAKHAAGK
jgi:hypothetical protein